MNLNERRIYEKSLIKCTDVLCKYLDVKYTYPLFKSKFILNAEDVQIIESEKVSSRRTQAFLDILMTRDVKTAFETLFEYVSERSYQAFLAKELRKALMDARNEFCMEDDNGNGDNNDDKPPSFKVPDVTITTVPVQATSDDAFESGGWWSELSNQPVRVVSDDIQSRLEASTTVSTVESSFSSSTKSDSISVISSISQQQPRNSTSDDSISVISSQINYSERRIPNLDRFLKP